MSVKKSNLLIPIGISATLLIAGGAAGYLYLRGAFSDATTPLASAKVVPDEALMTGYISTDPKTWSQLQQFGTPEAQNAIAKNLTNFNRQVFTDSKMDYAKDVQPWLGSIMFAVLPPNTTEASSQSNFLVVVGIEDKIIETIALISGHGISKVWSTVAEQSNKNPQLQQQIEQMRSQVKTTTELDLDRDIFGWMDGEFAIGAIASNEGILAPIGTGGAIVLKTSDRPTAEATLNKLNVLATKDNSITIGQRNVGGKTVTDWTIPQQGTWLSYGWLDDSSLLIAIGSPIFDAIASNSNSLDNSESFKAIAGTLPKPNAGYFYLDIEKAMSAINRTLPAEQKNSVPPEANAILNSIRGIGITAMQPDASTSEMEMLLALKPKSGK